MDAQHMENILPSYSEIGVIDARFLLPQYQQAITTPLLV